MSDIEFWLKNNLLLSRFSDPIVENATSYSGEIISIFSDVKNLPYVCTKCDDFTLQCKNLENLNGIPYFANSDKFQRTLSLTLFKCDNLLSYNFANQGEIDLWIKYSKTATMKKLFSFKQTIHHLNLVHCSNDSLYDISSWSHINSNICLYVDTLKRFKNLSLLFSNLINKNLDILEFYDNSDHKIYTREELIFLNETFLWFNAMPNPCEYIMDFCIKIMDYDNVFGDDL